MAKRQTYTVGEMASRIAGPGSAGEVAAITRQLRNWTSLGLLNPIGMGAQAGIASTTTRS
jgi:hypothetical protein